MLAEEKKMECGRYWCGDWNDILLLVADCFGHQCTVGGIMMICGCHLLTKGLMSGVKLVIL